MKKLIILITIIASTLFAQNNEEFIMKGKELIFKGLHTQDKVKMLESRAIFERLLNTNSEKWLINYYIGYCDYRLSLFEILNENKKEAKRFIKDGFKRMNLAIKEKPDCADAYALMGSLYGSKISISPISGMWNGAKSGKCFGQAFSMGNKNPRVYFLDGISKYYTPEKYGGGKSLAKLSLQKAIELYEVESVKNVMPDWGYDEAYTWLGIIENSLDNKDEARKNYNMALEINPENNWVKHVLIPEL